MIRFKCWYYEQAIQDGNEDCIHAMLPNRLPEDIQLLMTMPIKNKFFGYLNNLSYVYLTRFGNISSLYRMYRISSI